LKDVVLTANLLVTINQPGYWLQQSMEDRRTAIYGPHPATRPHSSTLPLPPPPRSRDLRAIDVTPHPVPSHYPTPPVTHIFPIQDQNPYSHTRLPPRFLQSASRTTSLVTGPPSPTRTHQRPTQLLCTDAMPQAAGSDDTASMIKGGGYLGAPAQTIKKKLMWVRGLCAVAPGPNP